MAMLRKLPYILVAIVIAGTGYLAGAVSDPFGRTTPAAVRGDLAPQEPQLRRDLAQARSEADDLADDLRRAQATIERLRTDLSDTRNRVAQLRQRAETAERARAEAQTRIAELAERVAGLEARDANRKSPAEGTAAPGNGTTAAELNGGGRDLRPGSAAVSAIDPSSGQAERLVSGVEAYQNAAYEQAFRAWLPLAKAGYARAQLHLGALFLEGRGTARNDPLAYAWLSVARDNGSRNAGPLLDRLRDRMSQSERDTARRLLNRARASVGTAG